MKPFYFLKVALLSVVSLGCSYCAKAQIITITPSTICIGDTAVMTVSPAGGTWSSSTSGGVSIPMTGQVVGVSAGVTVITYTLPSGIYSIATVSVMPTPTVIAGSPAICIGLPYWLMNGVAGGTWSSTITSIATIDAFSGAIGGVAAGTSTISYTLSSGCSAIKTVTVGIVPVSAITGPSSICASTTAMLSDDVGGGSWTNSNHTVATVGPFSGIVYPASTGTTIVTYTAGLCGSVTTTVQVLSVPSPITGATSVCIGNTTALGNAILGGTWSSGNTAVASIGSGTGIATGVSPGYATITYALASGCRATMNLIVDPAPAAITGPSSACVGTTVHLSDAVPGGIWTSTGSPIISSGDILGGSPGVDTIIYTLGSGCIATKTLTFSVSPSPIIGPSSVCLGSAIALNNTITGGIWSSSNPAVATISSGSSGVVLGMSNGTSTISYVLSSGCLATKVINIASAASPITGTTSVCTGSTTTLSDFFDGGTWSSGTTGIATVSASAGTVYGISAGTASITYNTGTCGTVYTTVIVNLIAPIVGATDICNGSSTTLSDPIPGGTWSSSNPTIATVGMTTGIVNCSTSGSVVISYTMATGCVVLSPLTVHPLPAPISGVFTACAGSVIPMTDATSGGTWSSSNSSVAAPSGSGIIGTGVGTAMVSYGIGSGCIVTQSVSVTSLCTGTPIAGVATSSTPATCIGSSITLNLSGYTYVCGTTTQWQYSPDGVTYSNITGATTVPYSHLPAAPYFYRCVVTCTSSGLAAYSTAVRVAIHSTIAAQYAINTPDTVCSAAHFYISACGTSSSFNVTTFYGDGTTDNRPLTAGSVYFADIFHTYHTPGKYSVKQILYNGTAAQDSATFSYLHLYCRTLPIQFYFDANSNCVYDDGDTHLLLPVRIEVDSNGIAIDTISATSGLYYRAFGPAGTIYAFKFLSSANLHPACPSSGILYDTIQAVVNNYQVKYFGFNCGTSPLFDLREYVSIRAGRHSFAGDIFIDNNYCTPQNAVVTLRHNPRYSYPGAYSYNYPTPDYVDSNSMSWNLSHITSNDGSRHIGFDLETNWTFSYWFTPGDTVSTTVTVTPVIGDVDTLNNYIHRKDTVTGSFDPNEIEVAPAGKVISCMPLQYTIHFENTGNDTARNISVMDTLSDYLDGHTLEMVAAASTMNIAMIKDAGYTIAKFDFPDINLPDSSHHGQSGGMLVFNIKTKPGLADGIAINNKVGIVFDDNAAVITNTVQNTIGMDAVTGPGNVCNGAGITLSNNSAGGVWSSSNASATVNGVGVVTGAAAGVDTIRYTLSNSCGAKTASKEITIIPSVTPTISVSTDMGDTACAGLLTTFTAAPASEGTMPVYQWLVNGYPVVGRGVAYSYIPANGDVVSATLTSNAVCAVPATVNNSLTVVAVPQQVPAVIISANPGTMIGSGQSDTLTASVLNGGDAPTYQWYVNGFAIRGATAPVLVMSSFANRDSVSCMVVGGHPCGMTTFNSVIISIGDVGIPTAANDGQVYLQPNPNRGIFAIKGSLNTAGDENVAIEIKNMLGQVVYNTNAKTDNGRIDDKILLSNLPAGVYILHLHAGGEHKIIRFVVE